MQRLIANGSDSTRGVTFNGLSFDYDVDGGRGKLVAGEGVGVGKDETVWIGADGGVEVWVAASSAAVVRVTC